MRFDEDFEEDVRSVGYGIGAFVVEFVLLVLFSSCLGGALAAILGP